MAHTPRQSPSETTIHKQSFFDSFDAYSAVDWLAHNGKRVIFTLLGLIALFIIVYVWSNSRVTQSEKDYLQASADFSAFLRNHNSGNEAATQETFQRLTALINSHPELHAAYDGAIAQTLLNRGQTEEAAPLVLSTLKRTHNNDLAFYHDFSAITLLISQKHYQEALKSSLALQANMYSELNETVDNKRAFSELLFAFNLLRVALLHQQLGNTQEEWQTWQEWKHHAGLDKVSKLPTVMDPSAFRMIIQQLATGTIALPDYIAYREKLLKTTTLQPSEHAH